MRLYPRRLSCSLPCSQEHISGPDPGPDPVHNLTSFYLKICFIIVSSCNEFLTSSKWSFSFRFFIQNFVCISSMCAFCPTHFNFLEFITLKYSVKSTKYSNVIWQLFMEKFVTSDILFQVLAKSDWLCLWDHILSNEPSFLLMAVVAYNIVCRTTIMSCHNRDDFEVSFFC